MSKIFDNAYYMMKMAADGTTTTTTTTAGTSNMHPAPISNLQSQPKGTLQNRTANPNRPVTATPNITPQPQVKQPSYGVQQGGQTSKLMSTPPKQTPDKEIKQWH